MKKWLYLLVLAEIILFQTACASGPEAPKEAVHWGYSGEIGPEYWPDLDPAYALARDGKRQSPIDISTANITTQEGLFAPRFNYRTTTYEVENNGHTIELVPEGELNFIGLDGSRYILQQMHFHAPSEHLVDGKHFDAELHLVHKSEQGDIAVVGIFLVEGTGNRILSEVFSKLPQEPTGDTLVPLEHEIDLSGLIADDDSIYRYDGSLTTPPCTEGVTWSLRAEPIEISAQQLEAFTTIYNGNNRPVQRLFERHVYQAR